jgi:hypothetical protein
MDRTPAFVDAMGETVFWDDLRASLLLIRMKCRILSNPKEWRAISPNAMGRWKNREALRIDKARPKLAYH